MIQKLPKDDREMLFNTRTSEHEEIALLFRMATDKLDQVEENAEKEKQQIVRDLAQELEKFRPIDRIASEIVEKLRKKVSKSVVYAALDERYKTSYRVQNARKRKKKKENKTGSLAPTSELKLFIVGVGIWTIIPRSVLSRLLKNSINNLGNCFQT